MKLYTVAGSSVDKGVRKLRFANDMNRAGVLARAGHDSIQLYLLPEAMSKEAATLWLTANKDLDRVQHSNSALMSRIVRDIKRVPRKGTDEERVAAQFALWRARAMKKHSFLVD